MSTDRLDDLEMRIAYLEDYLKQLNDVVLENGRTLENLKNGQTSLRRQLTELSEQLPAPEATKPPHY